jgi:glutathione-regulated potassium-efflux system protein KefB
MAEASDPVLVQSVVLLASAVVAVPIFRRLGLGSVLAYLAAGLAIGPFGLRLVVDPETLLHMTAAALLVVLGTALFMQTTGLSMAMGAFLAGVLLSESTFRHQLEADIEPFRGILLGLFFLSVGMSLNVAVVTQEWPLVLGGLAAYMLVKAAGIYGVARLFRASHAEAAQRAALFAQGGEFAFVLYAAALGVGILDLRTSAILTAIVILSMALTPLMALALRRHSRPEPVATDDLDVPNGLRGRVLFIGFGRFAQVVSQPLLARCVDLSLIEIDVDMIRAAGNFGFKVYYGDGTRIDVLRASGAERAEAILICVDKPEVADRIVAICKAEFPLAKLFVRAYDRGHVLRLVEAGVQYQIRETFESALVFGENVLRSLGFGEEVVADAIADVRRRDEERLDLQIAGGLTAGRSLLRGNMRTPQPEPLVQPRREGKLMNQPQIEDGEASSDRP